MIEKTNDRKNSRVRNVLIYCLIFAMMVSVTGCNTTSEKNSEEVSDVKVLKLNSLLYSPDTEDSDHADIWFKIQKPLLDKIDESTGGKLTVVPYFRNEISSVPEIFNSVVEGKADMAFSVLMIRMVDDFPISNLFKVQSPLLKTNRASSVLGEMVREWPEMQDEWKDVKVLYNYVFNNGGIATVDKPINSIDDLKGLRIICQPGWESKKIEALGALPTNVESVEDIRVLLEAGDIDGMVFDSTSFIVGYGFTEYMNHYVDLFIEPAVTYTIMNLDTWNSLTEDEQDKLDEIFGIAGHEHCDEQVAAKEEKYNRISVEEHGIEWTNLSDEELEKAAILIQPVRIEYAKLLQNKGYDGVELIERFDSLIEKYSEGIE